jgi:phosphoenolpyruvate synthase/pyruvate phosphate dikinase
MTTHSKGNKFVHTYIHNKNNKFVHLDQEIGGKATQLHNINPDLVPHWVAITADCPDSELSDVVQKAVWSLRTYTPTEYHDKYAVRSSALDEDGQKQSYAGIFESKLNVPITGIEYAVREVRDSARSAKVNAYGGGNVIGKHRYDKTIAVIIMPMVDAMYSGTLFTKEPVEGTDRMLLEYEEGVGGVVDGTGDSITFFLEHDNFYETLIDDGELSHRHPSAPLHPIWEEAKRLEELYGKPVDIEWAIDKNYKPWILQVRPITTTVTV